MTAAVEYRRLDHTHPAESERICRLLFDSYAVEAELIGAEDFPPLRRGSGAIRASRTAFFGCLDAGSLVAAAEIEGDEDSGWHIASFAVHPSVFRRGVGSGLLTHLLRTLAPGRVTVSTSSANAPAIALYEKHGFRTSEQWSTGDGLDMVTLAAERA